MFPTRSPDDSLSLADSLGVGVKIHLVPRGDDISVTSEKKTQDHQSVSPIAQAPVRSTLASINIVAACTSSLMITSALGSAFTISLPYVGEDLNIQKQDLQWILSAYSTTSVRIFMHDVVSR